MAALYRSSPMGAGGESHVLVVHCSDPRYQPHFQEFLHRGLGVDRYALVALPGGGQALAPDDLYPKFGWSASRWLKFMHQVANTDRVVLIAHDECRWYEKRLLGLPAELVRRRQKADLVHVREALGGRYGNSLRVETYFAAFDGDCVRFEAV